MKIGSGSTTCVLTLSSGDLLRRRDDSEFLMVDPKRRAAEETLLVDMWNLS
jgi:hypothetical protein